MSSLRASSSVMLVLQNLVDTAHRVRKSLIKLAENPQHIVEVGGLYQLSLSSVIAGLCSSHLYLMTASTVVIIKMMLRVVHSISRLITPGIELTGEKLRSWPLSRLILSTSSAVGIINASSVVWRTLIRAFRTFQFFSSI